MGRQTFPPKRYRQLYDWLAVHGAERILEIGTNDGVNAVHMVRAAGKVSSNIQYYGFDLFEGQDSQDRVREFSIRVPSMHQVRDYLTRHGVDDPILVAGESNVTLRERLPQLPKMDLVFIDGGHSYETVASDWSLVGELVGIGTCVFFDDYPNWGVGPVVDAIPKSSWDVAILPLSDEFSHSGVSGTLTCRLARVTRRS